MSKCPGSTVAAQWRRQFRFLNTRSLIPGRRRLQWPVRSLPFAANTPASELAAVVERVAANPTDAANRQQVRRLRSVTSALTPAQLGRFYACLKTEPQARFELPELVTVLGRAFGERCGSDAGKLGQLLGDSEALPFLRGYAQAATESTNR